MRACVCVSVCVCVCVYVCVFHGIKMIKICLNQVLQICFEQKCADLTDQMFNIVWDFAVLV